MVTDLEAGRKARRRHIPKWRLAVRAARAPKPGIASSQELIDLTSKLEEGTFLAESQLDIDAGEYVEYLQAEFIRRSESFEEILPADDKKNKVLWLLRVAGQLRDYLIGTEAFSIADAVVWLQSKGTLLLPTESEDEQHHLCTELVFTLIGIMSMLYSPRVAKSAERKLYIERVTLTGQGSFEQYACDAVDAREADRPLKDMLLGFGDLQPRYEVGNKAPPILNSQFNGYVLASIGRIRIAWTDLLPAHLDFDLASRTLYVFQRPTFCLLNVPSELAVVAKTHKGILASCLKCTETGLDSSIEAEYMKEILLSIHMLFGQSAKSRKLFRTPKLSESRSKIAPDSLLPILCTGPWPFPGWSHQPKKRYLLHEDFPLLNKKLQVVNDYLQRKQPSNIWTLWKDDRNPMQWWTFWAVVIIGGLGLILAAVQTGLSAAQLYYTMDTTNNGLA